VNDIYQILEEDGILPIVNIQDASKAKALLNAYCKAGIRAMEVTLRSEAALSAIQAIANSKMPMNIGAGTVLTVDECKRSLKHGATFMVTPCLNEKVVRFCLDHSVPVIPGCSTATEIFRALELGINVIKFFPAKNLGGLDTVKALLGPFEKMNPKFMPTGGINEASIEEYAPIPNVIALAGSWLAPRNLLLNNDFQGIEEIALRSLRAWRENRRILAGE